jgi:hypothetical protein
MIPHRSPSATVKVTSLEEFGRAEGDADVGERERSHAEAVGSGE